MKPTKNEIRAAKKLQMAACLGFSKILDVSFFQDADPALHWGKGGQPYMFRVNGKGAALVVDMSFQDNGWGASKGNTLFFIKGLSKMSYDKALSEAHEAIMARYAKS